MAREEAAKGNDAESQKYYKNAIARASSVKEQNIIRKEMSSTEGSLTKVVPSPSLKRQSTAKTKSFNAEFNKMKKFWIQRTLAMQMRLSFACYKWTAKN